MKRNLKSSAIFLSSVMIISIVSIFPAKTFAASTSYINKVFVDKARYNPADTVMISAEMANNSGSSWSGMLYLEISHNENQIYSSQQSVSLSNGQNATPTFQWTVPSTDFRGYLVKMFTSQTDVKTAAIDVSSDWIKFPRYGYIANFDPETSQSDISKQINALTQDYYINAFQFYDWAWRHEKPISRSDGTNIDSTWTDLFDRMISWNTIENYINAAHSKNAAAMAYMMSYAAREGYSNYGVSPQWGLFYDTFHQSQVNDTFINGNSIWMFAPSNTQWESFISSAYKDCINTAGFDGIQMDQLGDIDNVYDYNGNSYNLGTSFSSLINYVKNQLQINNSTKSYLDFNLVNGGVNCWAVDDVSKNANTNFQYSELWQNASNYNDIRNYVEQLRSNSGQSAVIAAYMNYYENNGQRYEAENASYSGVDVATNHPGFTGSGFLENFAQQGDSVQFTINPATAMTYSFVFQYGDSSDNATRTIYIDGNKVGKVKFNPQGTWDKFVFDAYLNSYLSAGTHTAKIAYDSDDSGAINLDSLTLGIFDDNSVRLTDAVIAASGASHIELGAGLDDVCMLAHEYFPNESKVLSSSLKSALQEHYKFITAYENLLYDSGITYSDQGNQYITINGQQTSGDGGSGSIYHITRMTPDYDILHLINLSSENDQQWRDTTSAPVAKNDLSVKYYLSPDSRISGVYLASPDFNGGLSQSLSYTTGTDSVGAYASFVVPSLDYWDMIYIDRTVSVPSGQVYEAERAIKTNVTVNTDHSGYTGTGFVDGFAELGDEVTFQVNAASSGNHTLSFKFANNTGSTATRHIYIDGAYVGTISMNNLANWDTWSTQSISANMTAGIHTVCIYYDSSDDHAINLDSLTVN